MLRFEQTLITNDAVVLGILAVILGFVFKTSHSTNAYCRGFYKYIPALLLCYFLPSLLNSFNVVDGETSKLYFVSSRYLLPACLVLLILSVDLKAIMSLGWRVPAMFFAGTIGIVAGGPIALLVVSSFNPELLGVEGPNAVWRGLATVAGSWIGGGANQTAMKEFFDVGGDVFSAMIAVDVFVANIWMAVLLLLAGNQKAIDAFTGADTSAVDALQAKVEKIQQSSAKIPSTPDYITLLAIGFGITGFSHFAADIITPWFVANVPEGKQFSLHSSFFWLIITATTIAIFLSFTKLRRVESLGASKVATVFLYILIASIGLHMNIYKLADAPVLFLVGLIWMLIHAVIMLSVAYFIKAPLFFMAVGSQANVGGAASAPVVASAFSPALAPIGVLLAIMGYAVGTYAAYLCGLLLQTVAS